MGAEKRALDRYNLSLPATVEVLEGQKGEANRVLSVVTQDVSAGGAYLQADQPIAEGTPVRLELVLEIDQIKKLTGKHAHIQVSGVVVRSGSGGVAVKFEDKYRIKSSEQKNVSSQGSDSYS